MMATQAREPRIILDLSRLISRVGYATPTGVDRCEMAYARGLLARVPDRLDFAGVHPLGAFGRLPREAVLRFLDQTEERWTSRGFVSGWDRRRSGLSSLAALRPRPANPAPAGEQRIYIQASPNNLTKPALMQRILKRERAQFLCLVHDLIPLEYPEYGRPDGVAKHRQRVRTIVENAAAIVANSHATLASLRPWIEAFGGRPATSVAHLGTHCPVATAPASPPGRPYFVCIGTIEPRKNHLLLLNIWRRMAETLDPALIPKLVVIGRRGWENEQIVDMLERCVALRGCVEEHNGMSDGEAAGLLQGARALLLPSFAEGYGMPVAEALSCGVPVICSDLAALREVGGDVPDYFDPLDGNGWRTAIDDYARPNSAAHTAQMSRIQAWHRPTWSEHIAAVMNLANSVTK